MKYFGIKVTGWEPSYRTVKTYKQNIKEKQLNLTFGGERGWKQTEPVGTWCRSTHRVLPV